jgi:hypothetical protein
MAGSTHTHTEGSRLAGMSIQTSLLGQPIPIGWGRGRLSCNLIDFLNFQAIPHTTTTRSGGGKGGGGSTTSDTTYTYTSSILLGICEGGASGILGINAVYKDSASFEGPGALAAAGLNLANGASGQTPWGYLVSLFPSHARAYRGIAYAYAQDYDLGDTATLANHGFEVDFAIQLGGGVNDADPKEIISDFLINPAYGVPGWSISLLGNLSDYSLYCRANNLLLSPVLDQQVQASEFLKRLLQQTNSDCFWSEGVLKIKPFGDASATANGVTWNPDLTPIYDLSSGDFLDEPTIELVDQADAYNHVSAEFLDRSNQYNAAVTVAYDLDDVVTYGRRQQDAQQFHDICDGSIARKAIQLWLQRVLFIRGKAHFDLPLDFLGLEPMDYVTLSTDSDELKLDRLLVQIEQIDEDEDGADELHLIAEIIPGHAASAAEYPAHISAGFKPDLEADPGNVATPILFNAPQSLAPNGYEAWAAVCGVNDVWGGANVWVSFDGTNYSMVGKIAAPARYGVLSAGLANHADPDSANTLGVNLAASKAALGTVTHAEADNGASLCMIENELISYGTATLTSAYHYDLTYLRRGQRGSAAAAHSSGASFIRLDDAIFRIAYLPENAGASMHVKFQSFNYFGRGLQDLASLSAYTLSLTPAGSYPGTPTGLGLAGGGPSWVGPNLDLICNPADRATSYRFDIYKSDGTTLLRQLTSSTPSCAYTSAMAALDGAQRDYKIAVTAINDVGPSATTAQVAFSNTAPAALASPSASGGATDGQVTATASSDPDIGGYIVFYSGTSGFDPTTSGGVVRSGVVPISIFGLAPGTYYARIAAYDPWTSNPALLNLSAEQSFTITTGGGSTPSGGGVGGGGFDGRLGDTREF